MSGLAGPTIHNQVKIQSGFHNRFFCGYALHSSVRGSPYNSKVWSSVKDCRTWVSETSGAWSGEFDFETKMCTLFPAHFDLLDDGRTTRMLEPNPKKASIKCGHENTIGPPTPSPINGALTGPVNF